MCGRSRGISHATDTATTSADAIAIPAGTSRIKIEVETNDCFAGFGESGTPPTLDTTNSIIVSADSTEPEWWHVDVTQFPRDAYVYIASTTSTATYRINFYG